ncbi:hypothetical protein H0H93_013367 [Arthromyces matolae]|nr:hypothetical protein H0H93_013367 [Arthromyces matolae]
MSTTSKPTPGGAATIYSICKGNLRGLWTHTGLTEGDSKGKTKEKEKEKEKKQKSNGCFPYTITVLENVRPFKPNSRIIIFDAHLWLGPQCQILASLCYFRGSTEEFNANDVVRYFIVANIVSVYSDILKDAEVSLEGIPMESYAMVGDIAQLIPLPDDANVKHTPFVTVSGIVDEANSAARTFDLSPMQYTAIYESCVKFPVRCSIPNTPQWASKYAKPKPGAYVTVGAF